MHPPRKAGVHDDSLAILLWDHALSLLPPHDLQRTTLALTRALGPHSIISPALVWRHLRLTRETQAWQAISSLRKLHQGVAGAVQSVEIEVWRDDPQLLVNLLLALTAVRSVFLTIGPLFAPEHTDELLDPASAMRSKRWSKTEQLWFRFNPYCMERSYYTFLKGAYFDSALHSLSRWPAEAAPSLRRLAFVQDLSPTHGVVKKETPAFGLHEIEAELELIAQTQPSASRKYGRKKVEGKLDFAQPIVFFQLSCITTLALSPVGSVLEHLVLRLPRRNLLTALTDHILRPGRHPFASIRHLDLSTTHIIDDARFPTLLRMHPTLEHLVIDRCTGLIGPEAVEETTAVATLKWLGKCCAGIGLARAEEALRAWRRIVKERPADAPNLPHSAAPPIRNGTRARTRSPAATTSDSSSSPAIDKLVPPVKELFVIPPPSVLSSLGCGLHDLPPSLRASWSHAFFSGYADAIDRTTTRIEEYLERWALWRETGKLADETRRMVTFASALPKDSPWVDWAYVDPDPTFARFLDERGLVVVEPNVAVELLGQIKAKEEAFRFCTVPDCSNAPGVPHLSLSRIGKETVEERAQREKRVWEQEKREEAEWRRPEREHEKGCAHLASRRAWAVE
ncbi:hypothetical protein JCM1840_000505 [Sporobolomyces johnsonii]